MLLIGGGIAAVAVVGVVVAVAALTPPPGGGQTFTETVTVTDAQTGQPVQNASVVLGPGLSGVTDASGTAVISSVPAGTYTLTVSATGYTTYSRGVTIRGNDAQAVVLPPFRSGGGGGGGTVTYNIYGPTGALVGTQGSDKVSAIAQAQALANANNAVYIVKDSNGSLVYTATPQAPGGGGGVPETAKAVWILPSGASATSATFKQGDPRTLATTVPPGTMPQTVQAFRTNPDGTTTPGNLFTWDITQTGYTYYITSSAAIPAGNYSVYTVVGFADGNKVKSNPVTMTIESSSTGGTGGGTSTVVIAVQANDAQDFAYRVWALYIDLPPGAYVGGGQWAAGPPAASETHVSGDTMSTSFPFPSGSHTLYFVVSATDPTLGSYSGTITVNGTVYNFSGVNANKPAVQAITV